MGTPLEADVAWCNLDLQTSVSDFELQHLARLYTEFVPQPLRDNDAAGGIDGGFHGRMLPRELPSDTLEPRCPSAAPRFDGWPYRDPDYVQRTAFRGA